MIPGCCCHQFTLELSSLEGLWAGPTITSNHSGVTHSPAAESCSAPKGLGMRNGLCWPELHFYGAVLTHWGRVTHICVDNLTIIGSDNGLSPGWRQAITWTSVVILLIGPLGTNFSEMLIEIHTFSFKKIHLKMSSGEWRPFCLGLNVLTHGPLGDGPLTRYVKLQVAHAPGMPGTFSPLPVSKEIAS